MKRKKWLVGSGIVAVLVVVLLLGGLATGAFAQASTLLSKPSITAEEAKAAVLAVYPTANVVEVELERENGVLAYEVELDTGLEVSVDANSGAILGTEQDDDNGQDDDADGVWEQFEGQDDDGDESDEIAPENTGITADDARAIAEKAYPDVSVLAIEFDREGGIDLFEAELNDGTDVIIDANSGEILWTEIRDAD